MLLSIFSLNLGTNIYSFIEYTKSEYYIHKLPSTGIISKKESFCIHTSIFNLIIAIETDSIGE